MNKIIKENRKTVRLSNGHLAKLNYLCNVYQCSTSDMIRQLIIWEFYNTSSQQEILKMKNRKQEGLRVSKYNLVCNQKEHKWEVFKDNIQVFNGSLKECEDYLRKVKENIK